MAEASEAMSGAGQSSGAVVGQRRLGGFHYGKHGLCRVQLSLPSAKSRTLGKELLPSAALGNDIHSAKKALPSVRHSAKALFAECQALGKLWLSAKNGVR